MMVADLQILAQTSVGQVLNSSLLGTLLTLCVWLWLKMLRAQRAATRFSLWFCVLVTITVLPLSAFLTNHRVGGLAQGNTSGLALPGLWAGYLLAAWVIFAALRLVRVAVGFWQLEQLRRSCTPVDSGALAPAMQGTLASFTSFRRVTIALSDRVQVPSAIGFFRPAVVFPVWAWRELPVDELNSVLLHELGHVRRWDDWTNLAQKIVGAVLFFHPAIWWLERRLAVEREMACDDLVVAETRDARKYAECLVALAEKSFMHRGLALVQAFVGRMRHTSVRLARLLESNRPVRRGQWRLATTGTVGLVLVCLAVAPHAPRPIEFAADRPVASLNTTPTAASLSATALFGPPAPVSPLVHRAGTGDSVRSTEKLAVTAKSEQRSRRPQAKTDGSIVARNVVPGPNVIWPVLPVSFADDVRLSQTVVVMQVQETGVRGLVRWTMCVWHVTVAPDNRHSIQPETTPKKI